MKKLLLLLCLCISTGASYAQIDAGTKYIGGTVGGSVQNTYSDYKTSSFSIKPAVGYFLNTKWMLGLNTEFRKSASDSYRTSFYNTGGSNQAAFVYSIETYAISMGPFARYYHQVTDKFSVFGEGAVGIASIKDKVKTDAQYYYSDPYTYYTDSESSTKSAQLNAGFAPGVVFFPTSKLGIELKASILTYNHHFKKDDNFATASISTKNNFNANLSLANTNIGIGYYF